MGDPLEDWGEPKPRVGSKVLHGLQWIKYMNKVSNTQELNCNKVWHESSL